MLLPLYAGADVASIREVRVWQAPERMRFVFDLDRPATTRVFNLHNPERLVVDFRDTRLRGSLPQFSSQESKITALRQGSMGDSDLRVVFDLKGNTQARGFMLPPYGQYGHRFVVDIDDAETPNVPVMAPAPDKRQPKPSAVPMRSEWVIAIDAGHGGDDPGAIGRRYRTYEKDVVLKIAKELAAIVNKNPTMRALLIRESDYFVSLKQRREIASGRGKRAGGIKADVFVSIHADSLPRQGGSGASVFALSQKGASSAVARFLADQENAADQVGGVDLADKDDILKRVLLDLSHTSTMHESIKLGREILAQLGRIGPLHFAEVEQAGFAVLKSPDIPSVLIETGFLSNPKEERRLRSDRYRKKLARSVYNGLVKYLKQRNDVPMRVATQGKGQPKSTGKTVVHKVKSGDTLSGIARRYGVKIEVIRFANNLNKDILRAGDTLRIPQ